MKNQENIHTVTTAEFEVLKALSSMMYAEYGYSDINLPQLVKNLDKKYKGTKTVDVKKLRGTLGSLAKKNLITVFDHSYDYVNGTITKEDKLQYTEYYLKEHICGMVDIWKEEAIEYGYGTPTFIVQ
jgi:hypothetical protein